MKKGAPKSSSQMDKWIILVLVALAAGRAARIPYTPRCLRCLEIPKLSDIKANPWDCFYGGVKRVLGRISDPGRSLRSQIVQGTPS